MNDPLMRCTFEEDALLEIILVAAVTSSCDAKYIRKQKMLEY